VPSWLSLPRKASVISYLRIGITTGRYGADQRQTGASLQQISAEIGRAGYAITRSGVDWLIRNSRQPTV
jgi:hypothetical protein